MHYVVTEYGIANLRGKSTAQRAEALIAIAHPNFRSGLMHQARQMGYLWSAGSGACSFTVRSARSLRQTACHRAGAGRNCAAPTQERRSRRRALLRTEARIQETPAGSCPGLANCASANLGNHSPPGCCPRLPAELLPECATSGGSTQPAACLKWSRFGTARKFWQPLPNEVENQSPLAT
jgi:hypothetical protein